jgi:two-component system, NarL family, response regulator NreC
MEMDPTTIVVADDHPVVRLGLRTVLEKEEDFHVIAEVFDGVEAVRTVQRHNPDVLLLDLMMPGMNGMYVTSEVKERSPDTRVIIFSMHASALYVQEAFSRKADGYVIKDNLAGEIVRAIRTVISGKRYLGDLLSEEEANLRLRALANGSDDPFEVLTAREREILYLIAKGRKNREIAASLGISIRTAEAHRAHLMRKLQLRNQAELVNFAIQKKILPAS